MTGKDDQRITLKMDRTDDVPVQPAAEPGSATIGGVLFAVLALALAIGASVEALGFAGRAGLAPLSVGIPTAVLLAAVAAQEVRRLRRGHRRSPLRANPYLWLAVYAAAFYLVGAAGALIVFSVALMRFRGGEPWRMTVIVTAATAVGFFLITEVLLGESLYRGLFLEQLR